uniref:Uncharacterized protein n=1 Tax=Odontella aurita TaxID=265563 RepID=A0A7S4JB22_9STRA
MSAAAALPETVYLDAQRWGSAMPCHRHLDERSGTRRTVSGVPYDTGRAPLAPTRMEEGRGGAARSEKDDDDDDDATNFLADDDRMLFQAGDMVSGYTPGFEGAAISGMDAAEHILRLLRRDESFFMSGGNQANETRCKR